jgi:hypothetical protein
VSGREILALGAALFGAAFCVPNRAVVTQICPN